MDTGATASKNNMIYRRFGRTELEMPVLSCGGMRYQFFRRDLPGWLLPSRHQKHVDSIVDKALAVGINHFETARDYGTSEAQLGKSLQRLDRNAVIVQTKVFPQRDPKVFAELLELSLSNLGLDYIDLLAIHGVNTSQLMEDTLRPGGCLDVAKAFKAEGKCHHIGFSTHAPTDLICQVIDSNEFNFINLHWYYINQDNWRAVEAAQQHDMGVFIISPSDKGGRLYDPSDKLRRLCEPLSPMVFNDLFCLSHPQVHTLSIGAARPSDFDEHLSVLPKLDQAGEILPPILGSLEDAATAALGEQWMQHWKQSLPTYADTPGQINIPVILWLRNLLVAYDMEGYAKMRYNLLGNGNHWFPGNNAAELDSHALQDCLSDSPFAEEIPEMLRDAHQRMVGKKRKRLSRRWIFGGA